ncbi:MAG TPA: hypothetical protein IAB23_00245 [Candidatus Scybalocola faecavium]|nr:hypothetical protein [Candidatus Scybalocola faecavium]
MSRTTPFTQEQIKILESNPYTHHVTSNNIVYTVAFKEFFFKQMSIPGMTTRKIMLAAGYDPSFFTRASLDALRKRIRKEASSPKGFSDPRGLSSQERIQQFAEKDLSKQRTDKSIQQMQQRIVHLEYQLEFLKKTLQVRSRKD